ncbi:MAG: hypothetical protein KDK99_02430 [Verrucomicrobiales bacterium]|nr:hypothetical protein [Verrucomicrobiales bacterium]
MRIDPTPKTTFIPATGQRVMIMMKKRVLNDNKEYVDSGIKKSKYIWIWIGFRTSNLSQEAREPG